MSLIHWLNQHPDFIEEVTAQVVEAMVGRPFTKADSAGEPTIPISHFRMLLPIQLEFAECVGSTCAIPFQANGIAVGKDGEEEFSRRGLVHGVVDVAFPEVGWSQDAYLRMYPHIERVVSVENVEFE